MNSKLTYTLPAIDHQYPLLSLPLAFKTELDNIQPLSQKIDGDSARIIKWQTTLGVKTKPRVGLVRSGGVIHKTITTAVLLYLNFSPSRLLTTSMSVYRQI